MDQRKFKTFLRYRASKDGWTAAHFHRLSECMGPTVTLFKIDMDNCIGGYSSKPLIEPQNGNWISDSTAMIFNLTTGKLFKV
jgi:hypothetical protein